MFLVFLNCKCYVLQNYTSIHPCVIGNECIETFFCENNFLFCTINSYCQNTFLTIIILMSGLPYIFYLFIINTPGRKTHHSCLKLYIVLNSESLHLSSNHALFQHFDKLLRPKHLTVDIHICWCRTYTKRQSHHNACHLIEWEYKG